jgi:hypothetical protein
MGNSNSTTQEQKEECEFTRTSIKNYNCPTIDIGNTNGSTGYIDFITPEYIGNNNVVKGYGSNGRFFIVIKAHYEMSDGTKINTFSTFFQRYSHDDTLWHCCGHYGVNLMSTDGGMTHEQYILLDELLNSKEIKLEYDTLTKCRLKLNHTQKYDITTHQTIYDPMPQCLKLGWP